MGELTWPLGLSRPQTTSAVLPTSPGLSPNTAKCPSLKQGLHGRGLCFPVRDTGHLLALPWHPCAAATSHVLVSVFGGTSCLPHGANRVLGGVQRQDCLYTQPLPSSP